MRAATFGIAAGLISALLAGCAGERPAALGAPSGHGAVRLAYDLGARPFPEVPLPSDLATRLDPTSTTGRRVNISEHAATRFERTLRSKANQLTGFGTSMPVSVPLVGPAGHEGPLLDLDDVRRRHLLDHDVADDVALLVNVDPASPGFGERVPLDFGHGNFPLVLESPDIYFPLDPRAGEPNLLFESVDEDADGDGRLGPGEDGNGDGLLGRPNVFAGMAARRLDDQGFVPGVDDVSAFYEHATDTLLFRPVVPLRQRTTYAVVLTRNLTGFDGEPVASPFDGIHPATQRQALATLPAVLERHGFGLADVTFAWTFTTQDVTGEMEAIRAGLYGHGPLARLADEFALDDVELLQVREDGEGQAFIMPLETIGGILGTLAGALLGGDGEAGADYVAGFRQIDTIITFTVPTPDFLVDRDGLASPGNPQDDDESFEVDPVSGEAVYGRGDVHVWCTVPRAGDGYEPPFDVVILGHGYTLSKFALFDFAPFFARFGLATCSIDAFGHGARVGDDSLDLKPLIEADTVGGALREFLGAQTPLYQGPSLAGFAAAFDLGRARDLTNDGTLDSGGDFYVADLFHTRDTLRQSMVDYMTVIRLLRSFDGQRRWPYDTDGDGAPDLAGDFDGDGRVDIAGHGGRIHMTGISLGGILSASLPGIEPGLHAAAPVAGGAGLLDIGLRSNQPGVPEGVFLTMLGHLILGQPVEDDPGVTRLSFFVQDYLQGRAVPFATTSAIRPGDVVTVVNDVNGERASARVAADGTFRIPIAADALTATEKQAILGLDPTEPPPPVADAAALGDALRLEIRRRADAEVVAEVDQWTEAATWQGVRYQPGDRLAAILTGLGERRQTPDFRRLTGLAALILDAADPAALARHYARSPLDFPYDDGVMTGRDTPGTHVLIMPTIGDQNVPINTGVAIARAAGIVDVVEPDPRWAMSPNDALIHHGVLEGTEATARHRGADGAPILLDPDDLDEGGDPFGEPNLSPPLRLGAHLRPDGATDGPEYLVTMRIPYVGPRGGHGFGLPSPSRPFDASSYALRLISWFFASPETAVVDDVCLFDASCVYFPPRVGGDLP